MCNLLLRYIPLHIINMILYYISKHISPKDDSQRYLKKKYWLISLYNNACWQKPGTCWTSFLLQKAIYPKCKMSHNLSNKTQIKESFWLHFVYMQQLFSCCLLNLWLPRRVPKIRPSHVNEANFSKKVSFYKNIKVCLLETENSSLKRLKICFFIQLQSSSVFNL